MRCVTCSVRLDTGSLAASVTAAVCWCCCGGARSAPDFLRWVLTLIRPSTALTVCSTPTRLYRVRRLTSFTKSWRQGRLLSRYSVSSISCRLATAKWNASCCWASLTAPTKYATGRRTLPASRLAMLSCCTVAHRVQVYNRERRESAGLQRPTRGRVQPTDLDQLLGRACHVERLAGPSKAPAVSGEPKHTRRRKQPATASSLCHAGHGRLTGTQRGG